jgi:WhiB family redox-sensing transcriptional regulator
MELDWMARGLCRGRPAADFFPSDGVGVERARQICAECPVCTRCLEYALAERIDHGVWGGTSERQRRRLQKARREAATSDAEVGGRSPDGPTQPSATPS